MCHTPRERREIVLKKLGLFGMLDYLLQTLQFTDNRNKTWQVSVTQYIKSHRSFSCTYYFNFASNFSYTGRTTSHWHPACPSETVALMADQKLWSNLYKFYFSLCIHHITLSASVQAL